MNKIFKNQGRFRSLRIFLAGIALLAIVLALFLLQHSKKEGTIKIGAIIPLSGPAWYHQDVRDSMLLATEEINSWGGINGRKIELIIEDSKTDSKEAKKAFKRIETNHHPLLYISSLSSISMALAPIAEEHEVILLALVATTPKLTIQNEWIFRYWPTADNEVPPIITTLEELNVKTLGIIYLNDEYGVSVSELLKKEFLKNGGTVKSEVFEKGCFEFKKQIRKLKEMEAIFTVGFASHLKNLFQQLREENFNGYILGTSSATWPPIRRMKEADGVYVPAPITYNQNYIFVKEAKENYEKKYNKTFNHFAANGYDIIKILAGLLEDREISRGSIRSLLKEEFIYTGVFGDIVHKSGEQNINFPLFPAQIIDGDVRYKYWR